MQSWGHASHLVPAGTLGKPLFFASSNWLRIGEAGCSSADCLSPQPCAGVAGGAALCGTGSALRCGLQGAPADVLPPCHGSGLASRLRLVRWSCSRSVCEEGFGRSRGRERGTGVHFSETLHYLTTPGGPALAEITLLPCRCFAWLGHSLDGSCTELHSGSVSLLHLRAVSILVNCTIAAAQDWTLVVCPTELA